MTQYGRDLLVLWSLEADIHYLNHGAFGALSREVAAVQDEWRARMEAQPARFFMSELPQRLRAAAAELAAFVGTEPERLGFVENASTGVSAVVGSLVLSPGDEIVTTDHVYNAVRNRLRHAAARTRAHVIEAPLGLPVASPEAIVDAVAAAITPRTRLLVVDHIASATAVAMPVERLVTLARSRGVPVLVDGAHAPGMVELGVDAIGADWYVGNCHKWLCAPKGAAFIAVSKNPPFSVHPTVISHSYGQGFAAEFDKVGTRDASAWLAVPAAIAFHRRLGGPVLRERNTAVARAAGTRLADVLRSACGAPSTMFRAMATVRIPWNGAVDPAAAKALHDALWQAHRIEVPVMPFAGALWLRISIQAYNDESDVDALAAALPRVLRQTAAA